MHSAGSHHASMLTGMGITVDSRLFWLALSYIGDNVVDVGYLTLTHTHKQ